MKNVISKISVIAVTCGLVLAGVQACGDDSDNDSGEVEPSRGGRGGGDQGANPTPTVGPTTRPTSTPTAGPTTTPTAGPTVGPTVGPTTTPTASPTGTPGIDPTIAPPGGEPTPEPTPTALPEPTALSQAFSTRCAGCHGPNGEGSGFAPKLGAGGNALTLEQYITVVRSGRNGMPAFNPSRISDADLANDHRFFELQRR